MREFFLKKAFLVRTFFENELIAINTTGQPPATRKQYILKNVAKVWLLSDFNKVIGTYSLIKEFIHEKGFL